MPLIQYKSINYPSTLGAGYWGLHPDYYYITWPDIVYSALTVGRANRFHVNWHGIHSYFEMVYRSALIFANLKSFHDLAVLLKTDAYSNLDPSEKSAVSYFLGLTFAKLTCDHFLSTPWLMHLDVYEILYPVELWKGKKRPDLIGRNSRGDWIVFEAKGRTGSFDKKAFLDAKKQTRNIKKISGAYPAVRAASEVSFSGDILAVKLEDPPEFNNDAPDLDISDDSYFSNYYEPFFALMHTADVRPYLETINNIDFSFVDISEMDIRIGLSTPILKMVEQKNFRILSEHSNQLSKLKHLLKQAKLGLDGILIQLGDKWSERKMGHEANKRSA